MKRIRTFALPVLLIVMLAVLINFTTGAKATSQSKPSTPNKTSHLQLPIKSFANGVANGIATVSANDIWVVGSYTDDKFYHYTITEHWNGSVWSVIPSPNVASSELNAVTAVSSNDVWAVGDTHATPDDYSTVLIEHWDGTRWSVVPSASLPSDAYGNYLNAVTTISANNIWAVGATYIYGTVPYQGLIEHWDGTRWNLTGINTPSGVKALQSIFALSANNIWAVGSRVGMHDTRYYTNIIHWDGKQWNNLPDNAFTSFEGNLYSVTGTSANNVWAVGYATSSHSVLIEHWDGTRWNLTDTSQGGASIGLFGISAVTANDIWAIGASYNSGSYVSEHWNGSNWTIVPVPSSVTYVTGVSALSANNVWAVGASQTGIIHWDGTRWSEASAPVSASSK